MNGEVTSEKQMGKHIKLNDMSKIKFTVVMYEKVHYMMPFNLKFTIYYQFSVK